MPSITERLKHGWNAFMGRSPTNYQNYGPGYSFRPDRTRIRLYSDRLLLFDEDMMSFAMGNCVTLEDTNGNRKLLKKRYEAKIDPVAATMDAYIAYKANKDAFE